MKLARRVGVVMGFVCLMYWFWAVMVPAAIDRELASQEMRVEQHFKMIKGER